MDEIAQPDADTDDAATPLRIDEIVEHWWQDHFPGSPVAQVTQAWNHTFAAKEELKRRLVNSLRECGDMQLAFGAGALWGTRTDATGSGIGPDQFGILQDVQIDWDWQTKELWGQYQFPVDIARGQGKVTGKAKFARIFGAIYGDLFFGQTPASGQVTVSENEAATVPGTGPYTATVANAANYTDDLGVFYASGANAGGRFSRVTTPSAAGQYSVNAATGVYTFAAADAGAALLVSYLYNTTGGKKLVMTNQLMGFTPTFKATFYTTKTTQGVPAGMALVLNACTATKLSLPTKIDDYEIQEFDFSAFADAAGAIGTLSVNE